MYSVWAVCPTGPSRWHYYVVERAGVLVWQHHYVDLEHRPPRDQCLVLLRAGRIHDEEVSPEEAEVVTGLYMPAAMDRLRELVHDSG